MTGASLAVAVIGQALAQARGLVTKHAVKQVDRLLLYSGRMAQLLIRCCLPEWMNGPAEFSLLSGVGASAAAMLGSGGVGGAI
jgi:hypothetical protein